MGKWRTQIQREDAGDGAEMIAARPPEAAYGKYVHCGYCSVAQKVDSIPVDETHLQCHYCGKAILLEPRKARVKAFGYGPEVVPAA